MEEGLAAVSAVANKYGDGKGNTITHAYGDIMNNKKSKKKKGK